MPEDSPRKNLRSERVDFRRNRQKPRRQKQWANPEVDDVEENDTVQHESVRSKGELSRKRTLVDRSSDQHSDAGRLSEGTVTAVRGRFVEVTDGQRMHRCTVRRVMRTRLIGDRSMLTVGDRVTFAISEQEGRAQEAVIEQVHPRRNLLQRSDGRRTHTLAANVDQALIIGSVFEPRLKPHLLDRYLVAAHAGNLPAIICITKVDLDEEGFADEYLELYRGLGYTALGVSAVTGVGIEELREAMRGKVTLLAGQSGVGKSTMLNILQPSLARPTAPVSVSTEKGRHTTTTAELFPLEMGGAVVDTPGIRALDVAMVPINELEMHFVEFQPLLSKCKFPNCMHVQVEGCAIHAAVEEGLIDAQRYESYVTLYMERRQSR